MDPSFDIRFRVKDLYLLINTYLDIDCVQTQLKSSEVIAPLSHALVRPFLTVSRPTARDRC
jgi:hypothetical protein